MKSSSSDSQPEIPPQICTDQSVRNANMAQSIWNSIIDLTGLGGLVNQKTPYEQLQDDIAKIRDETQDAINAGTKAFAKGQIQIDNDTIKDIMVVNDSMKAYVDMQDEIINGKITVNSIYIYGTFFLVIITIIFLLLSNAFKK